MRLSSSIFSTLFLATTVWAQSNGAHFQNNSVSGAIQSNGDLIVSFVEAGLGNLNVDYSLTGNVTATYYCVSNSGSIPNAANKTTSSSPVRTGASFEPKNGKVTGSIPLAAPDPPSSAPPTCGNGQSLSLQSVIWSDIVLTDTTNSVSINVTKGTFSITLFAAPQ